MWMWLALPAPLALLVPMALRARLAPPVPLGRLVLRVLLEQLELTAQMAAVDLVASH